MALLLWKALIIAVVLLPNVFSADEDYKLPIWNIAHMVNSIEEVDHYLKLGANSIEFDITFNEDGVPVKMYHGIPCDCFRKCHEEEDFDKYIDYLRQLTTPDDPKFKKQLVLLFFDFKLNKLNSDKLFKAGQLVGNKLLERYWTGSSETRAYILISIPSINQIEFTKGFRSALEEANATHYYEKIGYDFSDNEDLQEIQAVIKNAGLPDQIWLGDGITNCLPRVSARLLQGLKVRCQPESQINRFYWWTTDRVQTIKRTLDMGIDGLITNKPQVLVNLLTEEEVSTRLRLATYDDYPWKKFPHPYGTSVDEEFNETEILYNSEMSYRLKIPA